MTGGGEEMTGPGREPAAARRRRAARIGALPISAAVTRDERRTTPAGALRTEPGGPGSPAGGSGPVVSGSRIARGGPIARGGLTFGDARVSCGWGQIPGDRGIRGTQGIRGGRPSWPRPGQCSAGAARPAG